MENFYRDEDAESFHLISQNLRDLDLYLDVHFTDPLNKECTKIVEEIFRLLINNLDHGQPEHEELVEKMLDYTTGNWEGESIEKIEILTLYTRTHGGLPPDTLADTSRDGSTYLHRCAMHGNHGVLDYLLTNFVEGQDLINAVNHDGHTALRCAIGARSVECAKTLLQFGARLNIGGYDMALLHPGYGTPDDELKELLLEAGRRQWAKNTKKSTITLRTTGFAWKTPA